MATPRLSSLPTQGAWIEIILGSRFFLNKNASLPTQGAWIEIANVIVPLGVAPVAPYPGSVD